MCWIIPTCSCECCEWEFESFKRLHQRELFVNNTLVFCIPGPKEEFHWECDPHHHFSEGHAGEKALSCAERPDAISTGVWGHTDGHTHTRTRAHTHTHYTHTHTHTHIHKHRSEFLLHPGATWQISLSGQIWQDYEYEWKSSKNTHPKMF